MNITKNVISEKHQDYLSVSHENFNADFILPDYYKEISKIIKFKAFPLIEAITTTDEKISVAGEIIFNLIYLDEENNINSYDNIIKYTKIINTPQHENSVNINADQEIITESIRALGPKRFNINGVIEIKLSSCDVIKTEYIENVDDNSIEKKSQEMNIFNITYFGKKTITENSNFSLTSDNKINAILRKECNTYLNDIKVIKDKIYLSGEYKIKVIYYDDNCKVNSITFTLPISEVLDVPGVNENDKCYITEIKNIIKTSIKNENKDNTEIEIIVISYFNVLCGYSENLKLPEDIYSTEYNVTNEYKEINPVTSFNQTNKHITINALIKCNNENINISDCYMSDIKISFEEKDSSVLMIVDGICGVIYESSEGYLSLVEEKHSQEFNINVSDNNEKFDFSTINMLSCNALHNGNDDISLTCDIDIGLIKSEHCKVNLLTSVNKDDSSCQNKCGIILYYAQQGEDVWDIAKENAVSIKKMLNANNIDLSTVKEDTLLVLPNF